MFNHSDLYALSLLISAAISATSAFLIWKRRATAAALPLCGFMLALCVWSLTYACYWLATGPDARIFWLNMTYFGVVAAPGTFVAFVLSYTRRGRGLSRQVMAALAVEPLITLVLLLTDPWHGLFFAGKRTPDSSTIFDGGLWFWIHVVYSYGLMFWGLVMLVRHFTRSEGIYRKQTAAILFAGLLPWFSNIISLLRLNPWPNLDLTPIVSTLTGLIISYSLFRIRLLDIVPIARDIVVETMHDGVVVVDTHQRIIDVNPAAKRILAATAGSVLPVVGEPITRFFPAWPDWIEGDNNPVSDIMVIESASSHHYHPVISPVSDHKGRQRGYVLVLRNISERQQIEDALRESETRQRALLSAIPDLIFRYRADGTYLDFHTRHPADLLVPPEKFLGKTVREVMPPELAELTMQRLTTVLLSHEAVSYEYALEIAGKTQHFDVRMAACAEDEAISVIRNVTERKVAEKQTFELTLEKERVQLLTKFVQNVSHEFRTPLTIIQSTGYLMSRMDDSEKRRQKQSLLEDQVRRIARLVEMLVSLSKLDAGVPFECEPINLNHLVSLAFTQVPASGNQTPPKLDLDPALPLVEGDAGRLLEAISEIVGNALRYSEDQSAVTVCTAVDDNCVTIEVSDGGPGIPPEAVPHIFERFFRLDIAHTTPGFGLGLTIAQKIIERHGGHIQVESESGAGSRFTIRLPVSLPRNSTS